MDEKHKRALQLIQLLALLGLVLSGVSLYEHTTLKYGLQMGKSFCNINAAFNCDAVNSSAWSEILGVPLAAWGIIFYLMMLLVSTLGFSSSLIGVAESGAVLFSFAFISSLFSIALFFISEFVVHSICLVCAGMYLVNFLSLAVSFGLKKPNGLFAALKLAGGYIFSRLLMVFGFKTAPSEQEGVLSRFSFLVLVLAVFAGFSLSDFFLVRFIYPKRQEHEVARLAGDAAKEWRKAKVDKLELKSGSALEADYSYGDPNSPIQVVEFLDFECPACRHFQTEFDELRAQYSSKLHYTFKNFPLDKNCNHLIPHEMHKSACYAANFARCAGEQNKFWEVANYLFSLEALDDGASLELVQQSVEEGMTSLGLDTQAMKECMQSGREMKKIQNDIDQALSLGVEGTPSLWINGKRVEIVRKEVVERIFKAILEDHK